MKLYHGTSARYEKTIRRNGLIPRVVTDVKGNWDHTIPSRSDCIYLTDVYAPYFAAAATEDDEDWLIVETDSHLLDEDLLLPDEDYLEQFSRYDPECLRDLPDDELRAMGTTMESRTRWYREHLDSFAALWSRSLEGLGTCAYQGVIEPWQITRIKQYDPLSDKYLSLAAIDPMISLMNHLICQEKYRDITNCLMAGREYQPDPIAALRGLQ